MDDPRTLLRTRVPDTAAGLALVDWLAERFRYRDRASWTVAIEAGRISVDGVVAAAGDLLPAGAEVTYWPLDDEPYADTTVRIVHQDQELVVVDKPAHLVCHGDGAFIQKTLLHVLARNMTVDGQMPTLRLVHRLDRETSGLVLVARTRRACRLMEAGFGRGEVEKRYLAVVHGSPASDEFVVDTPIGRSRTSSISIRRAAGPEAGDDARPALTLFRVLHRGPQHAILEARPTTGRTHQIRVHLESVGLPVLGDKLYGRTDAQYLQFVHHVKAGGDARDAGPPVPRQMLHAHTLSFRHPGTGLPTRFVAEPPPDLAAWMETIRGIP